MPKYFQLLLDFHKEGGIKEENDNLNLSNVLSINEKIANSNNKINEHEMENLKEEAFSDLDEQAMNDNINIEHVDKIINDL